MDTIKCHLCHKQQPVECTRIVSLGFIYGYGRFEDAGQDFYSVNVCHECIPKCEGAKKDTESKKESH